MPVKQFVLDSDNSRRGGGMPLFSKYSLHATLSRQSVLLREEIDAFETEYLISVELEDLYSYLESEYLVECPAVNFDRAEFSERPGKIDVSQDRNRDIYDRSRPVHISGTVITIHVPVEGQPEILECAPNVFYMRQGPPMGKVVGQELQFSYAMQHADVAIIERRRAEDESSFRYVYADVGSNVAEWNAKASKALREQILQRRASLAGLKSQMPIPLRVRKDADYGDAPTLRRKLVPPERREEPALALEQFDQILTALRHASLAFERAPSSFVRMGEEDLRHHFLVGLNMMFEGNAGAETFNMSGKTDILLRVKGMTVFIAECKFWRGQKSFIQALDQLLRYISWRDTKAALLIFNRTRQLSEVLKQIPGLMRGHPNYIREEERDDETSFRYVVHHPDDVSREILLAVLVFEVPGMPRPGGS